MAVYVVNVKMKMPDFGTTTSDVTVLRWLVEPGQRVQRGQALLEIETDKSTMDVESIATGIVKELLVEADATVEAGQAIVIIETDTPADSSPSPSAKDISSPVVPDEQAKRSTTMGVQPRSGSAGLFSSNRAKKAGGAKDAENQS
jgi:pyruvate/2-oxoglutarate dehydrogenase complex dihydrolipoamide acyltransferase (E2) component